MSTALKLAAQLMGAKGGRAGKGKSKRRGGAEYYRKIALIRHHGKRKAETK